MRPAYRKCLYRSAVNCATHIRPRASKLICNGCATIGSANTCSQTNPSATLNDFIASTIFAVVAFVIMARINLLITIGVFLPLSVVVVVADLAMGRI